MYTEVAVCLSVNVRIYEYSTNMNPQEPRRTLETLCFIADQKG
jgi:hypothetical protein